VSDRGLPKEARSPSLVPSQPSVFSLVCCVARRAAKQFLDPLVDDPVGVGKSPPAECCARLPSPSCEVELHADPESDSLAFPKERGPQETVQGWRLLLGGVRVRRRTPWGGSGCRVFSSSPIRVIRTVEVKPLDRDGGLHKRDLRRRTAFFDVGTHKIPRGADRSELPLWGFPPPKVANGAAGLMTRPEVGMRACALLGQNPAGLTLSPLLWSKLITASSPGRRW
jgi:hypothetical protein